MKQINTASLGERPKLEIDGHLYTVRKMGAGESLASSQMQRRLEVLAKKEEAKTITEEEKDEVLSLGSAFIDMMASFYDDGEDGSRSKKLISGLSQDEITALYEKVWEKPQENNGTKANT